MYLEEIILEGYRRFLLNPIQRITYRPNTPLQIILGTNGSGKSSLLYELSVLPALTGDYDTGGSKTVKASHENSNYILKSTFSGSSVKHSFIKDGVELNDSGTLGVQKELVLKYFRYSFEIHDVLLAKTQQHTFTGMTTADRKKWLTILSKTDLSIVTKIWKELLTLARDGKGALKHISSRIANESSNLLTSEDRNALEKTVNDCRHIVTTLMDCKINGLPDYELTASQLSENKSLLDQLAKRILNRNIVKPKAVVKDLNETDLENLLGDYRQSLGVEESMYAHYCNEYAQLDSVLSSLQATDSSSLEDLEIRLKTLDYQIDSLEGQIVEFTIDHGIEDIYADTKAIREFLLPILRDIPENKDGEFNPTAFETLKAKRETLISQYNLLSNRKNQFQERLDHIKTAHTTECPKCTHKWIPGVNLTDERDIVNAIANISTDIDNRNLEIETLNKTIEKYQDYIGKLSAFKQVVKSYPRLHVLWNSINNREIIYENPELAVSIANKWFQDIDVNYELNSLRSTRSRLLESLEHVKILASNDSSLLTDRANKLQISMETAIVNIANLKKAIQEINTYKDAVINNGLDFKRLTELYVNVMDNVELLNVIDRNKTINKLIGQYQSQLAINQKQLIDEQTVEGIINDLKESHDSVYVDTYLYQLLSDAVGPVEGIIAEHLHQVIQVIVHQLNSVIGAVWTVPLYIKDCGMRDGELDYEFPMAYDTSEREIPDVKYGSSAQIDIVNFAFRLLVYTNLELNDYPLYVDEIGITFDETHRKNLMDLIRGCIESKQFSQTFMISHYADQYKAFISSETLVLDGTNISVPQEHNKHVVIE